MTGRGPKVERLGPAEAKVREGERQRNRGRRPDAHIATGELAVIGRDLLHTGRFACESRRVSEFRPLLQALARGGICEDRGAPFRLQRTYLVTWPPSFSSSPSAIAHEMGISRRQVYRILGEDA